MKNVRGITLADNEVVIREYEASDLEAIKGKGYVIATNRRLIYTGSANTTLGKSLFVRDTKIDSITGVEGILSHKRSLVQLIIGAIIAIAGLYTMFNIGMGIGLVVLAIGAIFGYFGLKNNGIQMGVQILSSAANPSINVSVEATRGFFARLKSHDAFLTIYASGPGAHTDQLIREIGALIQDIQTMGDLAIEKWKHEGLQETHYNSQSTLNQLTSSMQTVKQTVTASVDELKKNKLESQQQQQAPQQSYKSCSCGNKVQQDASFCGECGKKFEDNIFG